MKVDKIDKVKGKIYNVKGKIYKVRGAIKKLFFFTFGQKGGGGVSPNPKGFYQIFWHNLPKNGGFIQKTGSFFTIFRRKGGRGSWPKQKNPYQKKLRWSKKGEGGVSIF